MRQDINLLRNRHVAKLDSYIDYISDIYVNKRYPIAFDVSKLPCSLMELQAALTMVLFNCLVLEHQQSYWSIKSNCLDEYISALYCTLISTNKIGIIDSEDKADLDRINELHSKNAGLNWDERTNELFMKYAGIATSSKPFSYVPSDAVKYFDWSRTKKYDISKDVMAELQKMDESNWREIRDKLMT